MSGAVPHEVTWISPSEWWVQLSKGWVVPERAVLGISVAVTGLIAESDVRAALAITHSDVPLGQGYRTDRIVGSRAGQLSAAAERLDLAKRLQDPSVADALFSHQEALITYLLLTCFDLLGQPAPWRDFSSWLNSKGTHALAFETRANPVEQANLVHQRWLSEYGVKNAFYRFIDHILPPEARDNLLSSFDLTWSENPPSFGKLPTTDDDKKKYLYKLRNQYTHQAKFFQGVLNKLPRKPGVTIMGREQTFTATKWIDFATRNWPLPLEEAVRQGIASRLRAILSAHS